MRFLKPSNSLQIRGPAKVLGFYLAFSAVWVVASDTISHQFAVSTRPSFHIAKGLTFVIVSGCVLFWLSLRLVKEAHRMESTLAEIFSQTEFGIFIADAHGRTLDCNEACARMLGYLPEEIIGEEKNRFLPENFPIGGQTPGADSVFRYEHRDGRAVCARLAASRTTAKSGESFIVGLLQNVTSEVQAYQLLRKQENTISNMSAAVQRSEARSKLLMETDLLGVLVARTDGKILDANDHVLNLLGYTREELQSGLLTWSSMTAPGTDTVDASAVNLICAQHKAGPFEKEYVARDGSRVPVLLSAHSLGEDGSGLHEALVSVIDLREIKRTEAEVSRLAMAVESAFESILMTDLKRRIVYVNPAYQAMLGYSQAELLGRDPEDLVSNQTTRKVLDEIWQTVPAGRSWRGRLWERKKDGSECMQDATISPVRDKSGEVINYLSVRKDITREHALEQRLLQSQKMEAVGQLTGGIAHDINNVLQVVHSSAELAERRVDDPQYITGKLSDILKASERGAGIIAQLLAFSRKELVAPKVTNLNDVVKDTAKLLMRLLPENVAFATDVDSDLRMMQADRVQLSQVLINLCVNARDAMPDGGSLSVSTRNHEDGGKRWVVLSVVDSGTGIEEKIKDKIFEPFFTTKEQGKGTGLGLSTVRDIVQRASGKITVTSNPGCGTRFSVFFPAVQSSGSKDERDDAEVDLHANFKHFGPILVCEDEASVRAAICEYLEAVGAEVLRSANPEEALKVAANHPPSVLVTDVIMPGGSGVDLTQALRAKIPTLKVLLMSGHTEHDLLRRVHPDRNTGFLQKPFTASLLLQKLNELHRDEAREAASV
jgi:two-component system, cell cycle sensor histidine kinase and response regulator CckA